MRHDDQTVLSMQNSYQGPLEDFAMVVPVPEILQKENVKTLPKEIFDTVDQMSAPRLVEYWERDPCRSVDGFLPEGAGIRGRGLGGLATSGRGTGGGGYVEVAAEFKVGEYDIQVLETNDATTLDTWLKKNKYSIPDRAAPFFTPYVESGMFFFVAKVDAEKVKFEDGRAVLSPLRFQYRSKDFNLPIRLGMINSKGKQDLLVYILAQNQRYEVANYPNVTIPTNLEVRTEVRDDFANFYEALFSRTVEENPRAVVTEYAWQATKCDPCPTGAVANSFGTTRRGMRGRRSFVGGGLQPQTFATLGADVLNLTGWNYVNGWVLTRLHARYAPDDIGEDLVFKKAKALNGGRQIDKGSEPGTLRQDAILARINQFQGRYIIRHEWEGGTECADPQFGDWGPPPNPRLMSTVRDVAVREYRRIKAMEAGKPTDDISAAGPYTAREREAIAFHLRSKFGTSVAPKSADAGGASVAPSANTRGAAIGALPKISLASHVTKPVTALKIEPAEPTDAPEDKPATDDGPDEETQESLKKAAEESKGAPEDVGLGPRGCSAAHAGTSFWVLLLALVGLRHRR